MEIKIPRNINLRIGDMTWSFLACVQHVVDTNPQFSDRAGARAADRIVAALLDQAEDATVELRKEDHALLYAAFDKPAQGFCPPLATVGPDGSQIPMTVGPRSFVPYMDAVPPP